MNNFEILNSAKADIGLAYEFLIDGEKEKALSCINRALDLILTVHQELDSDEELDLEPES